MKKVQRFLAFWQTHQPALFPGSRISANRQQIRVVRLGDRMRLREDVYHLLLTVHWGWFWLLVLGGYVVANLVFATLYWLDPGGVANAQPGSFWDAFFFSVQTIATIGYGAMYPVSRFAQALTAIEALVGLVGLSAATSLMFARFSRPSARVLFSKVLVITPHHGQPTLMFRMANRRHNQILEARVKVALSEDQITPEGMPLRKLEPLKLIRSESPLFALSWTVMHVIDEASPLWGRSIDLLAATDALFIVSMTGLDEQMGQTVHARHLYSVTDLYKDHRFKDIISRDRDGAIRIDYGQFHAIEPIRKVINHSINNL